MKLRPLGQHARKGVVVYFAHPIFKAYANYAVKHLQANGP